MVVQKIKAYVNNARIKNMIANLRLFNVFILPGVSTKMQEPAGDYNSVSFYFYYSIQITKLSYISFFNQPIVYTPYSFTQKSFNFVSNLFQPILYVLLSGVNLSLNILTIFFIQFFSKLSFFLEVINAYTSEGLCPLLGFLDIQLRVCLFIVSSFVICVVSCIMPHVTTPVDGPLEPAQLAVCSVVQCSLTRFLVIERAIICCTLISLISKSIRIVIFLEISLAEHIIGLVDLFEFGIVALVSIWMVLFRQMVESLLDLLQLSCFRNSQYLIIVLPKIDESLL